MPARSDPPARPVRDPRLDFFRGLGMGIILIAHIPWNAWANWIPARFGFSDATEIFVFCSGVASALAFGRVFEERGWALGTARILHRVWQVYWTHIGVFVILVGLLAFADRSIEGARYLRHDLNLGMFLDDPGGKLLGLVTLTYVPNYFDILPMYLVILGLLPVLMAAASRWSPRAVAVLSAGLWLAAALRFLDLPAEMDPSGRPWFLNPFSWQLLFFLGFAFGKGWLAAPDYDRRLLLASVTIVAAAAPFSCQYGFACHAGWGLVPWLGEVHGALFPLIDKTHFGALRLVHFLAVAYIGYMLAGAGGRYLAGPIAGRVAAVGRQTLAVFLAGLVLAQALGIVLDLIGHGAFQQAAVNVGGCAALVAVAGVVDWFKASPWTTRSSLRSHARVAAPPASCDTPDLARPSTDTRALAPSSS